jgi:ABC-type oligopeptide transport system substrate-binding subunit
LTPLPRTRYIAFNASRGIFADPEVRRAAALALDRSALAAVWREVPTDQILSTALPGYRERNLFPLESSLARARNVLHGRTGRAVMPVVSGCEPCLEAAQVVQSNLGPIGIHVEIREVEQAAELFNAASRFDLVDAVAGIPYPDSATFLRQLLRDTPRGWVPAKARAQIHRVDGLGADGRQAEAAALAERLTRNDVPVAAYATPQVSQFIGPEIGCRVFTPFGYGLDLAALCAKGPSG